MIKLKLRQIVCDKTELYLTKEKKTISFGKTFDVSDKRAKEILDTKYKNKPVAEVVKDVQKSNNLNDDK